MSGRLTIDLGALAHNYAQFHRGNPDQFAVVVKADSYGLGVSVVAKKLWDEGCREFFVAFTDEGKALRKVLGEAKIYVLAGVSPKTKETIEDLLSHRLIPVLNTLEQCHFWSTTGEPAALHVDTGMARLGVSVDRVVENINGLNLNIELLVGHFARADEFEHSFNALQSQRLNAAYSALRERYPMLRLSLANSAGSLTLQANQALKIQTDGLNHLDRVGIGLYGGNPFSSAEAELNEGLKPVVSLYGQVLQVRQVAAGTPVGYGSTYLMPKASRLAILNVGYADGLPRLLSNNGRAYIAGEYCNIVGRISMDATIVDVGELNVAEDDWCELMGAHISVDEVASQAQTITFEILTGLSERLTKVYIED
ncbi:MAG: alanine racemase [Candidatus Azotimanducaceae bacterium]|jgi:alanine racemase|tara:strand:+ start:13074 stop:14174 length:1101 start_codon:yes stop_codon:yes gene_type:complete